MNLQILYLVLAKHCSSYVFVIYCLAVGLAPIFPDTLMLGMEIRVKVANALLASIIQHFVLQKNLL